MKNSYSRSMLWPAAPGLLVMLFCTGVAAVPQVMDRTSTGQVYTVQQLQGAIERDVKRWIGRTVLVQARVQGCLVVPGPGIAICLPSSPSDAGGHSQPSISRSIALQAGRIRYRVVLGAPDPSVSVAALPLVWGAPDPLLSLLRHVPLVGPTIAAPQVLHWGAAATYRVQLHVEPSGFLCAPTCVAAVLLDSDPAFQHDESVLP